MSNKTITSVRLSQAALQKASEISPFLSKAIRRGLPVLMDRYPDRISKNEAERLHRKGNEYDRLTVGTRTYTKIRLPNSFRIFCQLNDINISAACDWAILDAPRYLRRALEKFIEESKDR